jgi:hypothetical protein
LWAFVAVALPPCFAVLSAILGPKSNRRSTSGKACSRMRVGVEKTRARFILRNAEHTCRVHSDWRASAPKPQAWRARHCSRCK